MSGHDTPQLSIVIPSHNRRDLLREVLDALTAQIPGTPGFEVIVVADGCHDGTEAEVAAYIAPYPVRVVSLPGLGPAHARNAGAQTARADLLLFLDDDVIPTEGLVAAHMAAHKEQPGRAVLGPYPPEPVAATGAFRLNAKRWWQAHFEELMRPGHRYSYTDLLTGNLSLARATWQAVGGLDPQFAHAREDLELGVRLIKHGTALHCAPDALGWHQEHLTTSPASALRRAREEGRSDALIAIKHPDVVPVIKVARTLRRPGAARSLKLQIVRRCGFLTERVIRHGPGLLDRIERLGLARLRRRAENALREFCYLRGAAEALGEGWDAFAAGPIVLPAKPEIEIDLEKGIGDAEHYLETARPHSVRLWYGKREIATMPWSPAAERWSARHLRPFLARRAAPSVLSVLAAQALGDKSPAGDWLRTVGKRDYIAQLLEAQRQWRRPPTNPSTATGSWVQDRRLATRVKQAARRVLGNGLFRQSQATSSGEAQEAARGWLLLFVFFIHAMIGTAAYLGPNANATPIILKVLAPDVSAFFFLSGMAAPALAAKGPMPVLRQSLVLVLFAVISHLVGFVILIAGQQFSSPAAAAEALLVPLATGTGYSSFVAWFFIVLAVARIYAYAFLRSWLGFALLAGASIALIRFGNHLGMPDNVWEWRNWPTATLFFLIGMRLPDPCRLPNWLGASALGGSILIALVNRHGVWTRGLCFDCDPAFVAQPMIGQYGSIVLYVPQQILFVLFLLWIAQRSSRSPFFGATAHYFGRASLPILLLHGWVLLTLYPGMLGALPRVETPFLYISIFSSALVVHAFLYAVLSRPLDSLQLAIFNLSHGIRRRKRRR